MKRKLVYSMLVFALLSCSKEELVPPVQNVIDICAVALSENHTTRVAYSDDAISGIYSFKWDALDEISIIVPSTGNKNAKFITEQSSKISTLKGSVEAWTGEKDLYGIYPYREAKPYVITSSGITMLSSKLDEKINLSAPVGAYNINKEGYLTTGAKATAKSQTEYNFPNLPFRQVMSFIRFKITAVPSNKMVRKVTLTSTDSSKKLFISEASVNVKTANLTTNGHTVSQTITLVIDGSTVGGDVLFDYALFPCNSENDEIKITVYGSEEELLFDKITDKLALMRNHKYNLNIKLSDVY